MKGIIFNNPNKHYIIDISGNFIILFLINLIGKSKINLYRVNLKSIEEFKYQNGSKISKLRLPFLIAFSIAIGNILSNVESPAILSINSFAILCIICVIWIVLPFSKISRFVFLTKINRLKIINSRLAGKIYIPNKNYFLKYIFLKIMIFLSYCSICILDRTILKILFAITLIIFISWIKKFNGIYS
ncbi:hypothetical protein SAMN02745191_1969 [Anaerorhabdus furcosa]|uniref:Uncharacterized protein n=1 Tax=Anaerorhabdus furcosa TaxID=118967 RepID=A0A1T4PDP9_9FIRM|nr:hypothetical protein SAMN02745191_1969 [Anaerorhabdus furcosa]